MKTVKRYKKKELGYFTHEEISKILELVRNNFNHKVWFMLSYSLGLNVSELISLKVKDIDLCERKIHIRSSKKLRARLLPIPDALLKELKPLLNDNTKTVNDFLFSGRKPGKSIHPRSVQKLFVKIEKFIGKKVKIHILRKTIAIHLLESGWEAKSIAEFLGHSNFRATKKLIGDNIDFFTKIKLPLDQILG